MLAGCAEIVSTMDLLSWNDVTSATDEANGIQTYWKREQANEFTGECREFRVQDDYYRWAI